jgi:hypothetical protein
VDGSRTVTAPRTTFRRRRIGSINSTRIPRAIAEWFAGERAFTFYAHSWPWAHVLPDYWDAWLRDRPGAQPPKNLHPDRLQQPAPGSLGAELAAKAREHLGLTLEGTHP